MMNDDFFATCASKYINETWIFIYNRSWLECEEFILPDWSPPDVPFQLGHAGRRLSNDNDDDDENKLPVIKQLEVCSAVASAKN